MPDDPKIKLPAGYAPAFAIGFSDDEGDLSIVNSAMPLPVTFPGETALAVEAALRPAQVPLTGIAGGDFVAGPFEPANGRPVYLTISGDWEGTAQVERSVDGGATRHPLTAAGVEWGHFTANACEVIWIEEESNAALYLNMAVTSGYLNFRFSQ